MVTGCSAPKPKHPPKWYTTVPKDSKFIYAVGASETIDEAKTDAVGSMRESLKLQVDNLFQGKYQSLYPLDKKSLSKILKQNSDISKKISLSKAKVIKSKHVANTVFVLISIPRLEIFKKIKPISDTQYNRIKQKYALNRGKKNLEKFIVLDSLIEHYPILSSYTGYKKFLIPTYDATDELFFLKNMKSEYDSLRKSINIYILTDVNSRFFSPIIRDALKAKDISTENVSDCKNALKLLIISTTDESQEYSFNKSKSLLKMTTFDKSKNIISFKQHTFIGRSRKDYIDAKKHAASNLKYKIKKFGIFNFIGIGE